MLTCFRYQTQSNSITGGMVTAVKETRLDPRSVAAREFKPAAGPQQFIDGPPQDGSSNFLSSECVSVTDLHWWTSDAHILEAANHAGVQLELKDVVFAEHKVNGKSKGAVTINCRSPERASKLMLWFRSNDFQGKKIHPTYVINGSIDKVTTASGNELMPEGYNNQRTANVPGAAPYATNAHGGINFNRLRPVNRPTVPQVAQHGYLGMGRPPKGLFHKIESGQLGIQDGMQYGEWARQPAAGWTGLQTHYPSYASVDLDHPSEGAHAIPVGGLPYSGDASHR